MCPSQPGGSGYNIVQVAATAAAADQPYPNGENPKKTLLPALTCNAARDLPVELRPFSDDGWGRS